MKETRENRSHRSVSILAFVAVSLFELSGKTRVRIIVDVTKKNKKRQKKRDDAYEESSSEAPTGDLKK